MSISVKFYLTMSSGSAASSSLLGGIDMSINPFVGRFLGSGGHGLRRSRSKNLLDGAELWGSEKKEVDNKIDSVVEAISSDRNQEMSLEEFIEKNPLIKSSVKCLANKTITKLAAENKVENQLSVIRAGIRDEERKLEKLRERKGSRYPKVRSDEIIFYVLLLEKVRIKKNYARAIEELKKYLKDGAEIHILDFGENLPIFRHISASCKKMEIAHRKDLQLYGTFLNCKDMFEMCCETYNEEYFSFPSVSNANLLFVDSIRSDPLYQNGLEKSAEYVVKNPDTLDVNIRNLAQKYLNKTDLSKKEKSMYMDHAYLLMFRYIFDYSYASNIIRFVPDDNFVSKIDELRKLTPKQIGASEKFFDSCYTIPICDFPIDNMYSLAISWFESLQYKTNPIDFCIASKGALSTLQDIASKISCDKDSVNKKGAKSSDYLLCFDELFEVSLVICLASGLYSLSSIVAEFSKFQGSLNLDASLNFSFVFTVSLVEHIMSLDTSKVFKDVEEQADQLKNSENSKI